MGITISFGLQKGGVGKTTTTSITAYLIAQKHKVLAIDYDSQGNLTKMLSQRNIYDFSDKTILHAIKEKNIEPYIYEITDNLHIVPAEDSLAILPNILMSMYRKREDQLKCLDRLIEPVKERYDYILIDLPPNVGDHTLSGLSASDYAVVILQTEPFAYDAVERYLQTLEKVKDITNTRLVLAGILTCLMQSQTNIDNVIWERAMEDYGSVVFDTIIKRKARIKEFSITGISNQTKADRVALEQYEKFVGELIKSVEKTRSFEKING